MIIESPGIKTGAFFACKGVDLPAYIVDAFCYLCRISCFGTFKKHMFNKMRYAVVLLVFISGSSFDPDAGRNRSYVWYFFAYHPKTVAQCKLPVHITSWHVFWNYRPNKKGRSQQLPKPLQDRPCLILSVLPGIVLRQRVSP